MAIDETTELLIKRVLYFEPESHMRLYLADLDEDPASCYPAHMNN